MKKQGFTLIEMVLVIGIVSVLSLISTQSFFRGTRRITLVEQESQIVRDMREVQFRAMQGRTVSGASVDYSIRFETDRYIIFPGLVYAAGNTANQVVLLPVGMQFSTINFASAQVSFARGSGDVRGYVSGQDSVIVTDSGLSQSTRISTNARGIVFTERL